MITLRPYQEQILRDLREALGACRSVLVCAPPGSGKGSLISFIVHSAVNKGKAVIFAVRGRELVRDMSERVAKLGIEHGVLMGGETRDLRHLVQVASVDTLHRMNPKPPAALIILDEARQFMNPSGRRMLQDYGEDCSIIGADATPILLNGKGLGAEVGGIFERIVLGPDEPELIDQGYLCPSVTFGSGEPPDVTGVGKRGGDFDPEGLAAVCDKPKLVGDIVSHWMREAYGLKTVAFGVNRQHARGIRDAFVAAGIEFEYIDGDMPDRARRSIYERLDHGTLMGFSNVQIAGVGFDHPVISCIISGQPTLSLARWRQQLGRPARIYPGKTRFVCLDHAGNSIRHWPYGFYETPPVWTLEGIRKTRKGKASAESKAEPISMCKRPVKVVDMPACSRFSGPLSDDGKYMLPCFCYFKSGPKECPRCGLPILTVGRKIETEAGELKDLSELRGAAKAARSATQLVQDNKLRKRYLELVQIGLESRKANGEPYSPKWATMQFRVEFGTFPNKMLREEGKKVQEAVCTS